MCALTIFEVIPFTESRSRAAGTSSQRQSEGPSHIINLTRIQEADRVTHDLHDVRILEERGSCDGSSRVSGDDLEFS